MNQGADSPINDRAMPAAKKAAIPNSASARAAALDTDMNDNNAVADKTTRTRLLGLEGGAVKLINDRLRQAANYLFGKLDAYALRS